MIQILLNRIKLFVLRGLHFLLRRFAVLDEKVYKRIETLSKQRVPSETVKEPLLIVPTDPLFEDIRLITHGGGGLSGLPYLNCREAFQYYYEMGNRIFEYDVEEDCQGSYLLNHDGDGKSLIDERFHPLSLQLCLKNLSELLDCVFIFDCKFRPLSRFCEYLEAHLSQNDLQRIIVQVFDETTIREAKKAGIKHLLYVCMMSTDYMNAAELCAKYEINAISISERAIRERSGWEIFQRYGIHMYVYTINTVQGYNNLRKKGFYGVFSDFLTEKELNI